MLPNVRILLQNGQLGGLVRFAAGVVALIGTGVSVVGKIQVSDPRLIFNLQEAIDLGLDSVNNPTAYRQIKEFYDESGSGAELYVMIVSDTMTQTSMNDLTNANGIVKLLNYAGGRVRIYGTYFKPAVSYLLDNTQGIDADVFLAITKAQATCVSYAANQTPVRCLLEGRAFSNVGANLNDLLTRTDNRVGLVIGGSVNDTSCSVGLALGRLAKLPVQRKISRVKDGPLSIATAYVGGVLAEYSTQLNLVHDKGYITFRTFPGLTGYFFSSDQMATKATDDYRFMARGRIIDKASVIAYATYVEELDDEIIINADGTLDAGQTKYLEQKIENQINGSMKAMGEISSVKCTINPAQNVLSTNKTTAVLKIVPIGYNSNIDVLLGFDNPNV